MDNLSHGQEQDQGHAGYSGSGSTAASKMKESITELKDQVANKAFSAKDAVVDAGRNALDKIDEQRQPAARTLESAASSLHHTADSIPDAVKTGVDKVASAAHATADKLQATADYVRNNDMNAMVDDIEKMVKRYPGRSLLAAVALGFLVGRIFRSHN